MIRALLLALPLIAGSCAPDLAALAADHNALCIKITTIWATTVLDRNYGCETPAAPRPPT